MTASPLGGASQPIGGKKRRGVRLRAPPVVRPWKIAKATTSGPWSRAQGPLCNAMRCKPRPALGRGETRTTGTTSGGSRRSSAISHMPFCCHLLRGALRRRETLALRQPAAREGFEARLPTGWGVAKTKETILSVHAPLNEVWGRGYGYRPMLGRE